MKSDHPSSPRCAGVLLGLALAACGSASAQDYPSRPVKLVVPYAAGGAPDVLARLVGQRLSESPGHQFVVENRPGAGGIAASEAVAKAPADGYTLLVPDVPQLAINPYLFSKLPYDPVKDFAPVSIIAMTPMFIVVSPSLNVDSLPALIALAKSKKSTKHPDVIKRLNDLGAVPVGSTAEAYVESLRRSLEVFGKAVKISGLKVE